MKRIILLALLAVAGVYLTGRIKLGTNGAMDYLIAVENLTNNGRADVICDMMHDDLEVDINDRTLQAAKDLQGGKDEFCDLTHDAVEALRKIPHRMNVEWVDFEVRRHWLHPWTSEVSYTENRTLSIRGANVQIKTTSDNTMTLVQTFTGVKLRRLVAEAWVSE